MAVYDRALSRMGRPSHQRSWPVGRADIFAFESTYGHDDSRFAPEENEKYATTNAVYSVLASRARLMAGVEMKFFTKKGVQKKEVEDHRAVELYEYVNGFWSRQRLDRADEFSLGIWGESYWAVEPPSRESPLGEIWWLKPSRMYPLVHESRYLSGYRYQGSNGQWLYFDANEIVWQRYPNVLDEFSPMPPLIAAKLAADTSEAMVKSNRQLFVQGLQVAGLIFPPKPEVEWTPKQVDEYEWYLKKKFSGADRAHRWAVLRQEAKFQQLSMSPKDAEYIQGLNMTLRQVARVFGMQATLLGDLEQASPGDTQNLAQLEWSRTLAPDLRLRASEVKEQYLPMFRFEEGAPRHVEPDFGSVPELQALETAQWEREASQQDRGNMTINEWRRRRGWAPVPWGDAPWMPMNKGVWVNEGEEPKGKLVIPGQDPSMFGGGFGEPGNSAEAGWPAQAQQGGPIDLDENGVPSEVLPDDERSPIAGQGERSWRDIAERLADPRESLSHNDARRILASEDVRDWLDWAFRREGVSLNGYNGKRPLSLTR